MQDIPEHKKDLMNQSMESIKDTINMMQRLLKEDMSIQDKMLRIHSLYSSLVIHQTQELYHAIYMMVHDDITYDRIMGDLRKDDTTNNS